MVRARLTRGYTPGWRAVLALSLLVGTFDAVEGQTRFMYMSGQSISPAFEGWWPNEDGTYSLFFGYMNSNWDQEFDIEVGQRNYFSFADRGGLDDLTVDGYRSDAADRGQPTHFYPRRNPFLFTVTVPADFGDRELVWTLTSNGETRRAYASIAPDYRIDPQVISTEVGGDFGSLSDALRTNIPPELEIDGPLQRSVRVGQPVDLVATAADPDNLPRRRDRPQPNSLEQLYRPPSSIVAISGPGLRMSWIVYRGPAREVSFDPVQFKTWTDTRVYGNSPWSPPWIIPEPPADGRWTAQAVFDEPGEYVLRAVASDGSMFTYRDVRVTVSALTNQLPH